jgi:hypothetical protein
MTLNGMPNTEYNVFPEELPEAPLAGFSTLFPTQIVTNLTGGARFQVTLERNSSAYADNSLHQIYLLVTAESSEGTVSHCYASAAVVSDDYAITRLQTSITKVTVLDRTSQVVIPVSVTNEGNAISVYNVKIRDSTIWEELGYNFQHTPQIQVGSRNTEIFEVNLEISTTSSPPSNQITIELEYHAPLGGQPPEYGEVIIEIPIELFYSGGVSQLGIKTKLGVVMTWLSLGTVCVIGTIAILQRKDQQRFPQMYNSSEE